MGIWAVTVVYTDGRVVNLPMKGRTAAAVLRDLRLLNLDQLTDLAVERVDMRRAKEHQDAE